MDATKRHILRTVADVLQWLVNMSGWATVGAIVLLVLLGRAHGYAMQVWISYFVLPTAALLAARVIADAVAGYREPDDDETCATEPGPVN